MKTAYFDCFSGISGDMTVGALIDAGASFDAIRDSLDRLGVHGFSLAVDKVVKKGISATKFKVLVDDAHHHPHRHLKHVYELIDAADLADEVKANAKAIFEIIGKAEAEIHGATIERVHFHEVGAIDSIVDIVGACHALHQLGVTQIYASNVHVGAGTIKAAHGVMPVPAPATAKILLGAPTYGGEVQGELTTPTGAALLQYFCKGYGQAPPMTVEAIGYGAGDRDLDDRANVLRVQVGTLATSGGASPEETVAVVEANIDDMPGELFPPLVEALLAAGAFDAFWVPAHGKKGRPVQVVTALCACGQEETMARVFMEHSSTLGVRTRQEKRFVAAREWRPVMTPWGAVRVKRVPVASGHGHCAPEFEDCRAIASVAQVPVKQVYEAALAAGLREEWSDA
jgi:uncharacterized protein (TIGR00299 family) protein